MNWKTLLAAVVVALFPATAPAQQIVAEWNFNGLVETDSPPPSVGAGTAALLGGTTASFASGNGSSDPAVDADNAWNISTFPAQGADRRSAGVEFRVPTAGYEGLGLRFDFRASNSGSRRVQVLYSNDGTTFQDAAAFTIAAGAVFTNGLTVDLSSAAPVDNLANLAVRIVSDFDDDNGYAGANGAYGPTGTWRFDQVTFTGRKVGAPDEAPTILAHPASLQRTPGSTATFSVIASGTAPLSYQWTFQGQPIAGATGSSHSLADLTAAQAGEYRVTVRNPVGEVTSNPATLAIGEPPPAFEALTIAALRERVDPETFGPTNTTRLYRVEGTVTTWVNLTTPNHALFYIQDATAGVAVFHSNASNNVPPAGARVQVTAPVTHFNGLLELGPSALNAQHSVVTLGTGDPLPTPRRLALDELAALSAAEFEKLEGSLVLLTNVTLVDPGTGAFRPGTTEKIVDASGYPFDLRIDARPDIGGQAKPTGPFAVIGVMGQFDTSSPWSSGYQIIPSRFADLLAPSKAPTVRHTNFLSRLVRPGDLPTNTFGESVLLPGERLEMQVEISDPEGRPFQLAFPELPGLPDGSGWVGKPVGTLTGTNVVRFVLEPGAAQSGTLFLPSFVAWNAVATNTTAWRVYVPTVAEQRVVAMEFLPNPATAATSPIFNPLRRDPASENPSQHDEYLELVNFGTEAVDLAGWRIWDGTALRHVFYVSTLVPPSGAFLVYGGPLNGFTPVLDAGFEPASESTAGLALNNNGDTIAVYNAATNLVFRVVYPASLVAEGASLTRYPDRDGPFVPQTDVVNQPVSPGRQADGRLFSEPPVQPPQSIHALLVREATGALRLTWNVRVNATYSVWATDELSRPFEKIASGLAGTFAIPDVASRPARFYRISSP